jgi:hypothetical protein
MIVNFLFAILAQIVLAARRLHLIYKAFMHRHVENIGLLGSLAVILGLSYGLFLIDPSTPSLSVAMIQVIALAPVLLFVALHCATYTYKHLLPDQFKQFMGELSIKITQPILPPLEDLLGKRFTDNPDYINSDDRLKVAQFTLIYNLLKYFIRCTRFVLFGLPFYLLFTHSLDLLKFALSLQPR